MTFPGPTLPFPSDPAISTHKWHIAGLEVWVHGLDQFVEVLTTTTPTNPLEPPPLILLHGLNPRGQSQEYMHPTIKACLWDNYHGGGHSGPSPHTIPHPNPKAKLVLGVTFDQRNHGHRTVSALANGSFREREETPSTGPTSNPNHAIDMFGIYQGTYADLVQVMEYFDAYLEMYLASLEAPPPPPPVTPTLPRWSSSIKNIVVGVSLGGHAAYMSLLDEHVQAVAAVIGCADYTRLMRWRLVRQKMVSAPPPPPNPPSTDANTGTGFDFTTTPIPGEDRYLPPSFTERILARFDPAARIRHFSTAADTPNLSGKKLLVLTGGEDRLVPPRFSREVVGVLKERWGVLVGEREWPEVGHRYTEEMAGEVRSFVREVLEGW